MMEIEKEKFMEGLKQQFEDSDANNLNFDTTFEKLSTWDSLTKFSIIAFSEDEYEVKISPEQFKELKSPEDLFNFIKNY